MALARPFAPLLVLLLALAACDDGGATDDAAGGTGGAPVGGAGGDGGGAAGSGGMGGGGGVDPYEVRESAEVAAFRADTGLTFAACGVTTRICGDEGCTMPSCSGEAEAYECLQSAFAACTPAHLQDRFFPAEDSRITTDFFVVPTDAACELVAIHDTREAMMDCVSLDRYTCPVYPVADCALDTGASCTVESLLDDETDCG